jgi:hypothetical protein
MILPRKKYRPEKLFDNDAVKFLFVVHEGEDGDPMDGDTSDDDDGDDERKEESEDDDDLFISTRETKRKEGSQANKAHESYFEEEAETTYIIVGIQKQVVLDFTGEPASTSLPHAENLIANLQW